MTGITWLPVQDTINITICSSPTALTLKSSRPPITNHANASSSNTVTGPGNTITLVIGIENITVTNNTEANTVTTTASLSGWSGDVAVTTGSGTPLPHLNVTEPSLTKLSVPLPKGYNYSIVTLNITTNTISNASISVTLGYGCSNDPSKLAPFILKNDSWVAISKFTLNKALCTMTFAIPKDPIISILSSAPIPTKASQSTTSVIPSTTLPVQSSSSQENLAGILRLVINISGIAIIAAVLRILFTYRQPRLPLSSYGGPKKTFGGPSEGPTKGFEGKSKDMIKELRDVLPRPVQPLFDLGGSYKSPILYNFAVQADSYVEKTSHEPGYELHARDL